MPSTPNLLPFLVITILRGYAARGENTVLKIKSHKKLDSIRCGYAAGCEARLCLAVNLTPTGWASPSVRALPPMFVAKGRTTGEARNLYDDFTGEA